MTSPVLDAHGREAAPLTAYERRWAESVDSGRVMEAYQELQRRQALPLAEKIAMSLDRIRDWYEACGGIVLDPFLGSGTVGLVARRLGRSFVGIDLNPDYCAMAQRRIERDSGLFGPVPIVAAPAETRNQEEMAS